MSSIALLISFGVLLVVIFFGGGPDDTQTDGTPTATATAQDVAPQAAMMPGTTMLTSDPTVVSPILPTQYKEITEDTTLTDPWGLYVVALSSSGTPAISINVTTYPPIGSSFVINAGPSQEDFTISSSDLNSTNNPDNDDYPGEYGPLDDNINKGFVYQYTYLGTVQNRSDDSSSTSNFTPNVVSRTVTMPLSS